MADPKNTAGTTEKKARKAPVRKPVELAVVVRVTDESGSAIPGAVVDVLTATKDISGAFKLHKQTPGSDMVTYTISNEKKEATVEKAS
jgi:protocatechuate 3,4-dioxygenase beta subunit